MDLNITNKTVLGIAAHPDDLDFGASGSIAKFINEGAQVFYLILTDGTRGSEDLNLSAEKLKEMRHGEQIDAGKILGIKEVFFLDYPDGKLVNDEDIQRQVVKVIREVKPDIVITMDPTFFYDEESGFINHPDHRTAGQIALDCVFPYARNTRSFPELLEQGHHIHIVETVLLTNFCKQNFVIDISDTIETKLRAIKKHKSQFSDFEKLTDRIMSRAKTLGEKNGIKYAEGFIRISSQPHGL